VTTPESIGKAAAKIGSGLSRLWNVLRYSGKWATTTSARHYRESHLAPPDERKSWQRGMRRIDAVFRVLDRNPDRQPHCKWSAENKEREGLAWHDDMERIRELEATRRNSNSV
jgi:hypothetical protein